MRSERPPSWLSGLLKTTPLLAWIEIHKDELMADWDLAVNGQQPYKIEPLR